MVGKWMGLGALSIATLTAACSAEPAEEGASHDQLVALSTPCSPLSDVPGMKIQRDAVDGGKLQLRVGIMEPSEEAKADVLFMHGFADRFDNHLPLFETWRDAGLRVIAFDFPSHGETCGDGLDRYKINGIARLAAHVVDATRPAKDRPLLLSGWSTGGLVAVRMLEAPEIAPLSRPVDGAFLLAPGVDVRLVVGDKMIVTEETLTHDPNPPHRGGITPKSPMNTPLFATDLLLNARLSRSDAYPRDVPTFVVTGGEKEDVYVDTAGVEDWVTARQREGAPVFGLGCDGARHELDNETAPIRDEVRASAATFAKFVLGGASDKPATAGAACKPY